ncbi:hypothetical protein FMEAI12_5940003 [Parafrankia sp. Ea1.12]|nr:hypothetical protein FMEAI12_5940003 [Parafrankia sp. Ea1.12]
MPGRPYARSRPSNAARHPKPKIVNAVDGPCLRLVILLFYREVFDLRREWMARRARREHMRKWFSHLHQ